MTTTAKPLTKKDYKSDQDVRWCPGCGDYAVLNAVQSAFAKLGRSLHDTVIISGIGCSSRFPYYMETFGFHTIHGRALPIATGVKINKPELDVWVITGDGDGLSIGGNHFIHALRRNVGVKVLLFNNRIYGLTKGQYSPTSERGKTTSSTPLGSLDYPFSPISLALGARATFVARSIDVLQPHLEATIMKAAAHQGTAMVEIYQNCNIFNDGAFKSFTDKEVRADRILELEHGRPLRFGVDGKQGLRVDCDMHPEIVTVGEDGVTEKDVMVWDQHSDNPAIATALASMSETAFPVPIGVFRSRSRPRLEDAIREQSDSARHKRTETLEGLLQAGDTWVVGEG